MHVGGKHPHYDREWSGEDFGLNLGTRVKFFYTPIKLTRNKDGIFEGEYIFS